MTEKPETSIETATAPEVVPPPWRDSGEHRSARVYQVLAWVGIVAAVLFIVVVIFFSGVFFGRVAGGYHGWHRGYQSGQLGPDGSMDNCPMRWPGGMMGPDGRGPGGMMGPGGMGPGGMMGPGQSSATTVPPMPPFTQRPS
ncbi:hypothetical protein QN239_13665 [Mycolicibacterium sp. Y3]